MDVQKQIAELRKVNEQRANDQLAMTALINLADNVPDLENRLKTQLVWSGVMARLFFLVLLFLLIGSALLAWVKAVKEFIR